VTAQGGNSAAEVGQVPRIPAYRNVANAFLILLLKLAALNCPLDKRGQLTFVCRLQSNPGTTGLKFPADY